MRRGLVLFLVLVISLGFAWAQEIAAPAGQEPEAQDYNFGDMSSSSLTTGAWQALNIEDYAKVYTFTNKCIELYSPKAHIMQNSLADYAPKGTEFDYWALNDVGTCFFIKGMALKKQGKLEEAKQSFNTIVKDFDYAQTWDPKGWFWKPAEAANDQLKLIDLNKGYDFADYTSETLTVKSWEALNKNDSDGILIYTEKCISLYEDEAKKQQASLSDYAPKEQVFNFWALNDVGTCHFIRGENFMNLKQYENALKEYRSIIDEFSYAQCWDPRGWFWKPAVAARGKINKIIAEQGIR